MNFIIWLVVGGLIGWVASLIMKTDAQQGIVLNVVVGIVGALLGGWLIAPMLGGGTINQGDFSVVGLAVSLLGAVVLLAIFLALRRIEVKGDFWSRLMFRKLGQRRPGRWRSRDIRRKRSSTSCARRMC